MHGHVCVIYITVIPNRDLYFRITSGAVVDLVHVLVSLRAVINND